MSGALDYTSTLQIYHPKLQFIIARSHSKSWREGFRGRGTLFEHDHKLGIANESNDESFFTKLRRPVEIESNEKFRRKS